MRTPAPILLLAAFLGACASPLPEHDPKMAWVELYTTPANSLLAERLDGKTLRDGRYFQVSPGKHNLLVRFRYELSGGGGGGGRMGMGDGGGGTERTCLVSVTYDEFAAGQRYRLELRPQLQSALALLTDQSGRLVAKTDFQGPVDCLIF
ncbi:hypothetical protein D9M68_483300 [compost metagenome]